MDAAGLGLATVAAGAWVGAILFQTAVVAPTVFGQLDAGSAQRFLRAVFPRFFKLGLVCGVAMMAGFGGAIALSGPSPLLVGLLGAAAVMSVLGGASLVMVPSINAARDAGPRGAARFRRLHRLNVLLTVLILVMGLGVLAALGASLDLHTARAAIPTP